MPVRVRIHSSFVSTLFSRSKLVTTRGGTYPATPVIFAAMRLPIQLLQDGINSERLYAITYAHDKVNSADYYPLRYDFEAVSDLRGLSQHRRHRAIFELAQFNRVPYRLVFQIPRQPIKHFDFGPYTRGFACALAGNQDLQRTELLALL